MNDIQSLRQRFTIGNDSPLPLNACPKSWQNLLEKDHQDTRDTTALALLSHYQALAEQPHPPQPLEKLPLLQPLALPPVPAKYDADLKQALNCGYLVNLLYFLSDRGYSLPIYFWGSVPKNIYTHLPPLYDPWISYLRGKKVLTDILTAENWDDFPWETRLNQLENLRTADRASFRTLITSCFRREKSPQRLKILSLFSQGLCREDIPFLQTVLKDRSKSVVQLAEGFLYRLKPLTAPEMMKVVKKTHAFFLISHHNRQQPKIHAQKTVLEHNHLFIQCLSVVDIEKLAESFGLSLLDFALALDWEYFQSDEILMFMKRFIDLFSPQALSIFIQHQFKSFLFKPHWLYSQAIGDFIFYYLSPEEKVSVALESIKSRKQNIHYGLLLNIYRHSLPEGSLTFKTLKNTPSWKNVLETKNIDQLIALGLLLPATVAKEVLEILEPLQNNREVFTILRLNIALGKYLNGNKMTIGKILHSFLLA